jgi:hypothetical protein
MEIDVMFHEFFFKKIIEKKKKSCDGILRCFEACLDSSCIVPLTPLVIVMRGGGQLSIHDLECLYQWVVFVAFLL